MDKGVSMNELTKDWIDEYFFSDCLYFDYFFDGFDWRYSGIVLFFVVVFFCTAMCNKHIAKSMLENNISFKIKIIIQ